MIVPEDRWEVLVFLSELEIPWTEILVYVVGPLSAGFVFLCIMVRFAKEWND